MQDAAAVYAHVLQTYNRLPVADIQAETPGTLSERSLGVNVAPTDTYGVQESGSGSHLLQNDAVAHARINKPCKIVLIGDSAGGNLVLALARWIRDEALLPPPDGLLLLSPSCDPCE